MIVIWLGLACASGAAAQMALIGEALEAHSPCDGHVLFMERYSGGPPSKENYWNGTVSLDKWPQLSEVRLELTVDNPARIEVDEEVGRVIVRDKTFHIHAFGRQPELKAVKFVIRGTQRGLFPNVEKLTLNNEDICKHPAKVSRVFSRVSVHSSSDFSGARRCSAARERPARPRRRKSRRRSAARDSCSTRS